MNKQKWVRPILMVLTRSENRSESVLAGCKMEVFQGGTGPGNSNSACRASGYGYQPPMGDYGCPFNAYCACIQCSLITAS